MKIDGTILEGASLQEETALLHVDCLLLFLERKIATSARFGGSACVVGDNVHDDEWHPLFGWSRSRDAKGMSEPRS